MESTTVRARRPASPPLTIPTHSPPAYSPQRLPNDSKEIWDADQRRIAASKGAPPHSKKHHPPGGFKLSGGEWKILAVITFLAAGIRFFRISKPNSVVFDEVHFGKFASKYIKTQYYVDVHPPLAKLLITLAAFLFGFDAGFDFKDIGKVYEDGVPYVAMRMLPATLGLALVPLTYLTLRGLDCRATTALVGSLLVTFENGLITQSRLILLDSPLIFFTGLTTFLWVGFTNEDRHKPFTDQWWLWLTLTGLSLGAVASCKWVGLFTIATIGFSTILQLWNLLGDLRVSPALWIKHFLARALCLIVVPIMFYMSMFAIHFAILENSGDGDGFMSSEFQHTLGGRSMQDTFADVAIGSHITIRHLNTQGGYLHSHAHDYPGGSKQQQITLYPHRDTNNNWRIDNGSAIIDDPDFDYQTSPLRYITPGMTLRLHHLTTNKRLHSHDVRPPVSEVDFQNEVSAYGAVNFDGDANDHWIVEIAEGSRDDPESWKRVRTLRTHFRLKHALQGCYLFSHKVKLPEWGYEQQEVTCNKNAVKANSLWYIESATHPQLPPDAEKVNYKLPGFLAKFLELQKVMWITNAGLTDRHTYDSRPRSWPTLRRGINFWVKEHRQIYLIGNPIVWWLSSLAVFTYLAVRGFLILRAQRGFRDFDNTRVVKYDSICGFLFAGWAFHYAPFYLMSRQLFLHHYFPALYFAILLLCAGFDLVTSSARPRVRLYVAIALVALTIWTWSYFSPLAYGSPWTKSKCESAKWLKTWDFSCNDFLENYSDYSNVGLATPTTPSTATVAAGNRGHGAVVVEPPVLENIDTTSAAGGQPEPGHDVFAKEPVKNIKSEPRVGMPQDEKQMSTVTTRGQSVEVDDLEGVDLPEAVVAQAAVPEGPLLHDEQEAEDARNDLFAEGLD